jgi:hypothetical protein
MLAPVTSAKIRAAVLGGIPCSDSSHARVMETNSLAVIVAPPRLQRLSPSRNQMSEVLLGGAWSCAPHLVVYSLQTTVFLVSDNVKSVYAAEPNSVWLAT